MRKFIALIIIGIMAFANARYEFGQEYCSQLNAAHEICKFEKVHFYFGNPDNTTINSLNELCEAVDLFNQFISDKDRIERKHDSMVTVTVEFYSEFFETEEYLKYSKERLEIKTRDEKMNYRRRLNAFSKKYHRTLINNCVDFLSFLNYETLEVIDYSPFVVLKVPANEICVSALERLIEIDAISNISVDVEQKPDIDECAGSMPDSEVTWDETLGVLSSYDIVSDEICTGDGIRIGIYEAGGVCDTSNINIIGKDITLRDSSIGTTPHATNVTSVLCLIAPEAEYYVSDVNQVGVAWFIDNDCDIVNCSFGYYNNIDNGDGTYTDGIKCYKYSIDAINDYQIAASYITVIKSSGNRNTNNTYSSYNPNNKVTSPGYAYNVITVGGVSRDYVDSDYRWVHATNASFVCGGPQIKPNVSAPYTISIPNIGSVSGTSYSSPLVAGCVALLEEFDASYVACPESILSAINSACDKTYDYYPSLSYFDETVGAGIFNLAKMTTITSCTNQFNTNHLSESVILNKYVSLSGGTDIQIGLGWIIDVIPEDESIFVTNYDLILYDVANSVVTSTQLTDSNVEMIRCHITTAGVYRIVVYQTLPMEASVVGEWMTLTYYY